MADYETIELAEEAFDKAKKKQLGKLCPMIMGDCKENCASFNEGRVQLVKFAVSGYWRVTEACCDNAIVCGCIFHEGDLNVSC